MVPACKDRPHLNCLMTRHQPRNEGFTLPRMLALLCGAFLTHLASERNVAASTQNQALNALIFLYEQVLGVELEDIGPVNRADRPNASPRCAPAVRCGACSMPCPQARIA